MGGRLLAEVDGAGGLAEAEVEGVAEADVEGVAEAAGTGGVSGFVDSDGAGVDGGPGVVGVVGVAAFGVVGVAGVAMSGVTLSVSDSGMK
jgi:hypothetical protein